MRKCAVCKLTKPVRELKQIGSPQHKEYVCSNEIECRQRHYYSILRGEVQGG